MNDEIGRTTSSTEQDELKRAEVVPPMLDPESVSKLPDFYHEDLREALMCPSENLFSTAIAAGRIARTVEGGKGNVDKIIEWIQTLDEETVSFLGTCAEGPGLELQKLFYDVAMGPNDNPKYDEPLDCWGWQAIALRDDMESFAVIMGLCAMHSKQPAAETAAVYKRRVLKRCHALDALVNQEPAEALVADKKGKKGIEVVEVKKIVVPKISSQAIEEASPISTLEETEWAETRAWLESMSPLYVGINEDRPGVWWVEVLRSKFPHLDIHADEVRAILDAEKIV